MRARSMTAPRGLDGELTTMTVVRSLTSGSSVVHGGQESGVDGERVGHRGEVQHPRHEQEVRPRRVGQEHLVAGPRQRQQRRVDRLHATLGDDHLLRRHGVAVALAHLGGKRLAQRPDARARLVAGVALEHGHVRRLDDVRRRREVGLADLEADDAGPAPRRVHDLADAGPSQSRPPRGSRARGRFYLVPLSVRRAR